MFGFITPALFGASGGGPPVGQEVFTGPGTFKVPARTFSISAVAISTSGPVSDVQDDGEGGVIEFGYDAGAGACGWQATIPTTPDEVLTIVNDANDSGVKRGATWLLRCSAGRFTSAGAVLVGTGFSGGQGRSVGNSNSGISAGSGSGAGGYSSAGENARLGLQRGGGGTTLLGGTAPGGIAGGNPVNSPQGQTYGGGHNAFGAPTLNGGVRIIYGAGRAYPNTLTGDLG